MNGRVHRTLSILLLSALTGCASGPFHRKTAPVPVAQTAPPELSQTPLYSPEMSEATPHLPSLPSPSGATVLPAPEPIAQKPRHAKKARPATLSTKNTAPGSSKVVSSSGGESPGSSAAANTSANAPTAADNPQPGLSEKKQPSAQVASSGAAPSPSPIGELTTGSSADAAETSHHTEDLIRSTHDGLESMKRSLSDDEKKTASEIRTFLTRAQQALKNGDVDGALGLATKAKLLLDELTGS